MAKRRKRKRRKRNPTPGQEGIWAARHDAYMQKTIREAINLLVNANKITREWTLKDLAPKLVKPVARAGQKMRSAHKDLLKLARYYGI